MKNRTNKILELLTSEKKVEVSQLAEYLDVSQVTVRKDLDALEAKGIIKREHGYAVLCSADDINGRIAYHYEEKKKIELKSESTYFPKWKNKCFLILSGYAKVICFLSKVLQIF